MLILSITNAFIVLPTSLLDVLVQVQYCVVRHPHFNHCSFVSKMEETIHKVKNMRVKDK